MLVNYDNIVNKFYLKIWIINAILLLLYFFWTNSSVLFTSILNYSNVTADPFDWTVSPIKYNVNFLKLQAGERQKTFLEIDSSKYIDLPEYNDAILTRDITNLSAKSEQYLQTVLARSTFWVPYLWSYADNIGENKWSHPAVDISAVTWTPVRSIAAWVVVKSGFNAWWFGNYVVIRHKNVPLSNWKTSDIYSWYAHLNEIIAVEWTKIAKWEILWFVWSTWMSTAPHLHFQIDLPWAPSHLFWPFSSSEASKSWLNFYSWINEWLWKEKVMEFTINPFEFVYNNLNNIIQTEVVKKEEINATKPKEPIKEPVVTKPVEKPKTEVVVAKPVEKPKTEVVVAKPVEKPKTEVVVNKPTQPKKDELIKNDLVLLSKTPTLELVLSDNDKILELKNDKVVITQEESDKIIKEIDKIEENVLWNTVVEKKFFTDIKSTSKYYNAIKYFYDAWLINWYDDNTFRENGKISRAEYLAIVFWWLWIIKDNSKDSYYKDVPNNSWEKGYVNKAADLDVIVKRDYFNPSKNISRVEWLSVLLKLKKEDISKIESIKSFSDLDYNSWYVNYVNYSVKNNLLEFISNDKFWPNVSLTRWEVINMMYKLKK